MIPQELRKFLSVVGVLVNTKLEILAELFVEFLEILSILTDFLEEFNTLFSDVLLDDLENFVVLKIFSADVKRKILRINHTSDEAKILGNEFITIVHNEDSSHVKFDVIFLLLGLEHIEGSTFRYKDN
jgi:hypothetical protein